GPDGYWRCSGHHGAGTALSRYPDCNTPAAADFTQSYAGYHVSVPRWAFRAALDKVVRCDMDHLLSRNPDSKSLRTWSDNVGTAGTVDDAHVYNGWGGSNLSLSPYNKSTSSPANTL